MTDIVDTKSSAENNNMDDGPLFRATIKEYESKTLNLKGHLKRILKAAMTNVESKQLALSQDVLFIETLKEAPFAEPLFINYLNHTQDKLQEQQTRLMHCMQSLLIHPLQKLYDMDIKMVDSKRKKFEETSKEYYTQLSKYLKPTRHCKEKEFLNKKREFDLIRFDYYSFLKDLHGGKKEQEILYHLLNLYEKQYSFFQNVSKLLEPHQRGLIHLAHLIAEASKEQKLVNQERDEQRKILLCESNLNIMSSPTLSPQPVSMEKFKGIRDLEASNLVIGRRKEGFLFATVNTTFDTHWHKYWCVLSNGQLHEYSNWKRQLESHIEPIHLRFATVREVRNSERKFCFEVITPSFKRVYQATSNEELLSWIGTINNAIQSLLNGMSSSVDISTSKKIKKHKHRSLSGALSGLAAAKDKYILKKNTKKKVDQQVANIVSTTEQTNTDLLDQLRNVDESNTLCADCSAKDPDWCSLNLGILICIECSGIHRSLGTHISKVRSLTLDSASFTPDIVQLLLSIGNEKSNSIWEHHCSPTKPVPTDNRDTKLKYIQSKYIDKAYTQQQHDKDPMVLLLAAIEENNILKALEAVALGANINQPFSLELLRQQDQIIPLTNQLTLKLPVLDVDGNEYVDKRTLDVTLQDIVTWPLHFALLGDTEGCSRSSSSSSSSSSTSSDSCHSSIYMRVFPMAEFLIQNGADAYITPQLTEVIGYLLDQEALQYLNSKNTLRGHPLIPGPLSK